ncbi:MAG TPA: hypothetical protein VF401_02915 [Candidatus Saccharimonadales bacterium]
MFERFKKPPLNDEEKLIKAGVLSGREDQASKDLAIRGMQAHGIPSKIAGSFEGNHPVPDLTSTEEGRAELARLDKYVEERIRQLDSGEIPPSTEDFLI